MILIASTVLLLSKAPYFSDLFAVDTDLSKYLSDTKKGPHNVQWLEKCRKAFCSVLTAKPEQARGNGRWYSVFIIRF